MYFSPFWRLESKIGVPACSGEGCLPDRGPLAVSSGRGGGEGPVQDLLPKGTDYLHVDPALTSNHLPKALPPNIITLGIRFSTYELRGDNHSDHTNN